MTRSSLVSSTARDVPSESDRLFLTLVVVVASVVTPDVASVVTVATSLTLATA